MIHKLRIKALCLQKMMETDRSVEVNDIIACHLETPPHFKRLADHNERKRYKALTFFHLAKLCLKYPEAAEEIG